MNYKTTISAIYCINLDCRPEKRKFMDEQAKQYNLDIEFFTAKLHPKGGIEGCKDSHKQVIELAKKQGLPNVLILEDDAMFLRELDTLPYAPDQFDMLYLGGNVQKIFEDPLNDTSDWKRIATFTTHSYIINHTLYDTVIRGLSEWTKEIDVFYSNIIHPRYQCYMLFPMMCIQRPGYSDIESKVVDYAPYINDRSLKQYLYIKDIIHRSNKLFMDKIFIINLQRRADRWEKVTKMLNSYSLEYSRWEAIDSKTFQLNGKIRELFHNNNFESERSIMACALSHIELWRYLAASVVYNKIMVFEDDIEFRPDFQKNWENCYKQVIIIDPDWDIIYLGGDSKNPNPNGQQLTKNITKPHQKYFMGAFAYCITKKFAQKMIALMQKYQVTRTIDLYMVECFHNLKSYVCHPFLVDSFIYDDSDVHHVK